MNKRKTKLLTYGAIALLSVHLMACSDKTDQANYKKLEQEVVYLKDNQEIRNLLNTLNLAVDASNAAKYKANYAPDGIFELIQDRDGKPTSISKLSTNQIEPFLNSRFEIFAKQGEQRRHLQTSIEIIEQNGTQAKATITGLLLTTVKNREIKLVSPLFYEVDLVKVNDGWKFKHVKGYLDASLDAVKE